MTEINLIAGPSLSLIERLVENRGSKLKSLERKQMLVLLTLEVSLEYILPLSLGQTCHIPKCKSCSRHKYTNGWSLKKWEKLVSEIYKAGCDNAQWGETFYKERSFFMQLH